MKKLLFILTLCPVLLMAQTGTPTATGIEPTVMKSATGYNKDTVTSATNKYLYSKKITGMYETLTVTAVGTEISATTTGTFYLESSQDSTVWTPAYFRATDSTFTLTDVTGAQAVHWIIHDFGEKYVRVRCLGGGSTNFEISAKYMTRRRPITLQNQ